MRKMLFISLIALSFGARAQQSQPVGEDSPIIIDGIEYGYSIKNATRKEVSSKDFSRYEVSLYATNKSECSRIILFNQSLNPFETNLSTLANFDCVNATGARLTSKSGQVNAKSMFVNARVSTRDEKGKASWENQKVQIGYYIGVGETVEENVIFIVPLNSKPDIRFRTVNRVSTI